METWRSPLKILIKTDKLRFQGDKDFLRRYDARPRHEVPQVLFNYREQEKLPDCRGRKGISQPVNTRCKIKALYQTIIRDSF